MSIGTGAFDLMYDFGKQKKKKKTVPKKKGKNKKA